MASNHLDSEICLNYYESYVDCTDNLVLDMQVQLTKIKELDIAYAEMTKQIQDFLNKTLKKKDGNYRLKLLSTVVNLQNLQLQKLDIIQSMHDIIQDKSNELERNYELFGLDFCQLDHSQVETSTMKENNAIEREQRQSKRSRRGAGAMDEHDNVSYTEHQTNKSDNTTMSSASKANAWQTSKKMTVKKKKRRSSNRQQQVAQRDERNPRIMLDTPVDPDEPTYCLCDQISYGAMIGCDNDLCPIEWFHFACVSLTSKPKGKWYCPKCRGDRVNVMKPKSLFLKELERYNKEKEKKTSRNY